MGFERFEMFDEFEEFETSCTPSKHPYFYNKLPSIKNDLILLRGLLRVFRGINGFGVFVGFDTPPFQQKFAQIVSTDRGVWIVCRV